MPNLEDIEGNCAVRTYITAADLSLAALAVPSIALPTLRRRECFGITFKPSTNEQNFI